MVHIIIDDSTAKAKALLTLLKDMPFVEIKDDPKSLKDLAKSKSSKKISKEEFLNDFKSGIKEIKEGKTKSLKELLHG